MTNQRLKYFKADLRALLLKHHAVIKVGYSDCSDTHGMSGEHMNVQFTDINHTHQIVDEWGISPNDLK